MKIVLAVIATIIAVYVAAFAFGAARWKANTRILRARLDSSQPELLRGTVDFRSLTNLPAPVVRYFHKVLEQGQPIVARAHMEHSGTFNMSETAEQWKPFVSEQWVITRRPGFLWNGRISVLPAFPARVHDAYVAGEGILNASLLGLVSVADMRGGGELAEGELMRYFAEATWYPTALLPGEGVEWEAIADRSARGIITDGATKVTLTFTFDDQGLVETVSAESRGRTVNGEVVPTPWRGKFWNYERRNGMLLPTDGEVAWLLPDGDKPYWRGHITAIGYEFAR